MSVKRIRRRRKPPKGTPEQPDHERVGYGKPPKAHQFKPGKSGNPKGRPKGAKNEKTIWRNRLYGKIAVRENGIQHKISVLEAILLRFIEGALKGDTRSAMFILNRLRSFDGSGGGETGGLADRIPTMTREELITELHKRGLNAERIFDRALP